MDSYSNPQLLNQPSAQEVYQLGDAVLNAQYEGLQSQYKNIQNICAKYQAVLNNIQSHINYLEQMVANTRSFQMYIQSTQTSGILQINKQYINYHNEFLQQFHTIKEKKSISNQTQFPTYSPATPHRNQAINLLRQDNVGMPTKIPTPSTHGQESNTLTITQQQNNNQRDPGNLFCFTPFINTPGLGLGDFGALMENACVSAVDRTSTPKSITRALNLFQSKTDDYELIHRFLPIFPIKLPCEVIGSYNGGVLIEAIPSGAYDSVQNKLIFNFQSIAKRLGMIEDEKSMTKTEDIEDQVMKRLLLMGTKYSIYYLTQIIYPQFREKQIKLGIKTIPPLFVNVECNKS